MGFIVDLIFIPINILVKILAFIIGSITGWVAAIFMNLFDKLFHREPQPVYTEEEYYDPSVNKRNQELIDQLAKLGK